MQHDITNTEVFKPLRSFIETEEYTDADLFDMIASYIPSAPSVAQAMSLHARDIIQEMGAEDVTYTEIICLVYWRTFFSPEHASLYGTDHMVHNPEHLANFAQYLIDPTSVEPANVRIATSVPLTRH